MRLVSSRNTWNILSQGSTVTTHIQTAINNGRVIRILTSDKDRHLLSVRTYKVEGSNRLESFRNSRHTCCCKHLIRIIVEVAPTWVILQGWVVRISIRAVTTAIYIAIDAGHDTYSVACIDVT